MSRHRAQSKPQRPHIDQVRTGNKAAAGRKQTRVGDQASTWYEKLQRRWNVFYDASGAIGRRYRRQDEIGTPFGITIDFDTIEKDGTVTLRDRDTCEQRRVTEDELIKFLEEQIDG